MYEGLSQSLNIEIKNELIKLDKINRLTTVEERQYTFLTFLQGLGLDDEQTFNVYTNTTIK